MQFAKDEEEKREWLLIARITSRASPSKNKFPQLDDAANWEIEMINGVYSVMFCKF
jgi:hypothetical protein